MRRFGVLLASAVLGAVFVAGGPGLAFGRGGGGGGGHFGGFGGFRGGGFGGFHGGGFGRGFHGGFARGGFGRGFHGGFARGGFGRYGGYGGWGDWGLGGGWGDSYSDNGYSGYNYPGSYYSSSTFYGAAPLASGRSVAYSQPGNYCIISVKACQLHDPPFVGNDCSCKVPGGTTSEVP
jgi:hypothetical protein